MAGEAVALEPLWSPRALAIALTVSETVAIVQALAPGVDGDRWTQLGLNSLVAQWITLSTLALLYVARRRLAQLRAAHVLYAALGTLLACGLVAGFVVGKIAGSNDDGGAFEVAGSVAAVGLLGVATFENLWRRQDLLARARRAELEALQARIRPHFLFNTLNTGAALVHEQPEAAERLLLDLADLFRAALAGPREITLEEELSLARRYIEIEQLRFGERLRVEWQLPRDVPRVMVPALSIQPLVENAIRHGVERIPQGGRIEIALTTTTEHVVVRIANPLVFSEQSAPTGHRVGLNASQARIEALTGGRGSVQTGVQGELYVATVRLPRPRPANRT